VRASGSSPSCFESLRYLISSNFPVDHLRGAVLNFLGAAVNFIDPSVRNVGIIGLMKAVQNLPRELGTLLCRKGKCGGQQVV
jgi:hypothetical protein